MKLSKYIFVIFLGCFFNTNSQILKGGDIYVKNVFGNTQQVTARIAIDWPIVINKPFVKINWGDGSPLDSLSYGHSSCGYSNANTLYYQGFHSFLPNNTYTISIMDSFMVSGIANIPNSSSRKLYLRSIINTNYLPNTTPNTFGMCLTENVQCCSVGSYNPGAYDVDGDSISYAIDTPLNISDYINPPITLNPYTGTINFIKSSDSLISVSLRIDEWRQSSNVYYKISSTYKELLFTVYNPLSIYENKFYNIKLFPNPTNSILTLVDKQNQLQTATISIANTLGEIVLSQTFASEIDLSNLANGMYYLTVQNGNDKKTIKVVKN